MKNASSRKKDDLTRFNSEVGKKIMINLCIYLISQPRAGYERKSVFKLNNGFKGFNGLNSYLPSPRLVTLSSLKNPVRLTIQLYKPAVLA